MAFDRRLAFLFIAYLLSACGGNSVIKDTEPLIITEPLASAADERLGATLDWIIVSNGPGSWAKNVVWDEYLMRVRNLSDQPIRVTNVVVLDSTGTQVERGGNGRQLIEGTKRAESRYKNEELKVRAGAGTSLLVGAAVTGATAAAITATSTTGYYGALAGAGTAALGLVIVMPFAVAELIDDMNDKEFDKQIELRQTLFPEILPDAQERRLDLFYPFIPSPRQVEVTYVDSHGEHTLVIDTRSALNGLHLVREDD